MKILVSAGNTQTPIDRVRCITNIFTGRTGTRIALEAAARGHQVVLLTSHPEVVKEMLCEAAPGDLLRVHAYGTFDELEQLMATHVGGGHDALVHCAAVSDYAVAGVFMPEAGTRFDPAKGSWTGSGGGPRLLDACQEKVTSRHGEVWLRLTPTPKLVDRIRGHWGFRGTLVKFKLEVGVGEEQLRQIAEESRRQSGADLMVANTLEGMHAWALLGPVRGEYQRTPRADLAARLLDEVERLQSGEG